MRHHVKLFAAAKGHFFSLKHFYCPPTNDLRVSISLILTNTSKVLEIVCQIMFRLLLVYDSVVNSSRLDETFQLFSSFTKCKKYVEYLSAEMRFANAQR
jgi:hypothetical protein